MSSKGKLVVFFRMSQILGSLWLFKAEDPTILLIILLAGLLYGVYQQWHQLRAMKPVGGYANWITLSRALLLSILLFYATEWPLMQVGLVGLWISISDFLDGFLARKLNSVSVLGGYLDEETDTFYVIAIGSILYHMNLCGVYILLPGMAKYMKDVGLIWFAHRFQQPVRIPAAKWIAGISFILYLSAFFVPPPLYTYTTVLAVTALCLSLGVEMVIRFNGFSKN